jgi:hypothetical protein
LAFARCVGQNSSSFEATNVSQVFNGSCIGGADETVIDAVGSCIGGVGVEIGIDDVDAEFDIRAAGAGAGAGHGADAGIASADVSEGRDLLLRFVDNGVDVVAGDGTGSGTGSEESSTYV